MEVSTSKAVIKLVLNKILCYFVFICDKINSICFQILHGRFFVIET